MLVLVGRDVRVRKGRVKNIYMIPKNTSKRKLLEIFISNPELLELYSKEIEKLDYGLGRCRIKK